MRRADARRVAVQKLYILISLDFQGKSGILGPSRTYPELFALLGGRVPDLRGLFLRGYGSQNHAQNNGSTVGYTSTTHSSGALGQVQGDATRNIQGNIGVWLWLANGGSGAFEPVSRDYNSGNSNGNSPNKGNGGWDLNISRVVPTAEENRPVNQAVRYLVRARP